ncbi:MAG: hypothetical protein DRP11_00725, partial [Candidatus Aenigmatarchaeota archaeon]
MSAALELFLITTSLSFLIALIYKFTLDQNEIKGMRERMEKLKKKIDRAKKEKKKKEMEKYMSEMMSLSSKQMQMTMKPMMLTFAVVIPFFIFIGPALYGDAVVHFENGSGLLEYNSIKEEVTLSDESFIINGEKFGIGDTLRIGDYIFTLKSYDPETKKLALSRTIVNLPFALPFIGDKLGWIGWYILLSVTFTQVFRKLLGVV